LLLSFKQQCPPQEQATCGNTPADESEYTGIEVAPSQQSRTPPACGIVTLLGKRLHRFWKIGPHWLTRVKNLLLAPFDRETRAILGRQATCVPNDIGAQPSPLLGNPTKPRPNGVVLEAAHLREKAALVHDERVQTFLPTMLTPAFSKIDSTRIASVGFGVAQSSASSLLGTMVINRRYRV
jgi:hypothetical protein